MSFTFEERAYLNALSKRVYGSLSHWYNKIYKLGVKKTHLDDQSGASVKYLQTFEALKEYMNAVDAERTRLLEKMKAEQDANKQSSSAGRDPSS